MPLVHDADNSVRSAEAVGSTVESEEMRSAHRGGPRDNATFLEHVQLGEGAVDAVGPRPSRTGVVKACFPTTRVCNLRVRQASTGPRSTRNTPRGSKYPPQAQA
jgi:hypothetical protein